MTSKQAAPPAGQAGQPHLFVQTLFGAPGRRLEEHFERGVRTLDAATADIVHILAPGDSADRGEHFQQMLESHGLSVEGLRQDWTQQVSKHEGERRATRSAEFEIARQQANGDALPCVVLSAAGLWHRRQVIPIDPYLAATDEGAVRWYESLLSVFSADRIRPRLLCDPPLDEAGLAELVLDLRREFEVELARPLRSVVRRAAHREGKRQGRRRSPGRPQESDPQEDERIADAWVTGGYSKNADLARALGLEEVEVRRARERHRKRMSGRRRKN